MSTLKTASQKLQIRKWSEDIVRAAKQMPTLLEVMVDLPLEHDAARKAAKERALLLARARRVRSCSALSPSGFVVAVEV